MQNKQVVITIKFFSTFYIMKNINNIWLHQATRQGARVGTRGCGVGEPVKETVMEKMIIGSIII